MLYDFLERAFHPSGRQLGSVEPKLSILLKKLAGGLESAFGNQIPDHFFGVGALHAAVLCVIEAFHGREVVIHTTANSKQRGGQSAASFS